MYGRIHIVLGSIFLTSLAIRIAIASQGIEYIDRMFLPDDTYYTLAIARSIANGLGPTADGVITTSGFQPLIALFLVPVFLITQSTEIPILASVIISLIFGAASCTAIAFLIFRTTRSTHFAVFGGVFAASSPSLLRNDLNGLETSLALSLALTSIALTFKLFKEKNVSGAAALGVLIGLSILARVDMSLLAVAIGIIALKEIGTKLTAITTLSASITVAPWWIYCQINFGVFIPESGMAVKQLTNISRAMGRPVSADLQFAIHELASSIHLSFLPPSAAILLIFASAAALSFQSAKKGNKPLLALTSAATGLTIFYIFYLPAFWFYPRYLHFTFAALIIVAAGVMHAITKHSGAPEWKAASLIGVLLIGLNAFGIPVFFSHPISSLYSGEQGAKGYREVAKSILLEIPRGATLAAMQTGALSYYAEPPTRVVNLDGVVNRYSYLALKTKNLYQYLKDNKVTHFADWDINAAVLLMHTSSPLAITPISAFKPQGADRFRLFRVDY